MRSETALKERSRSKTSVTSEIRSVNTNERILRKASCRACSTLRKKTEAEVTEVETSQRTKISGRRGRLGRCLRTTGTPPVSSDARIVRRTSTCTCLRRPAIWWPWVARRRLSWATVRCTAARSCSGPEGRARSSSLSGRDGGRRLARSIWSRSSSRRRCCSKARIPSRESWLRAGAGSGPDGSCRGSPPDPERRSSARRMRCTSTPITPEPSPRRPKAAMARRARSRMAASSPSRIAAAMRARSCSRSSCAPASSRPPCSVTSWARACSSAARKKKRSQTRSKTRRSSADLASVAASASLTSERSVQRTSSRAENASRSSSPSCRTRAERPSSSGTRQAAALDPDALGHRVEVGPVLDDDAHRVREDLAVDVLGAQQQQGAGPVDRLGDRRRLLEVQGADHPDHLDQLAGHRVGELRRVQAHDLQLVVARGVVEPEVQAAALERLGQLARVVGGQQHDRPRARLDAPELGDRDLEVREQLEQHRLELLVGLVDLVDEQDHRPLGGDRRHQRAGEEELLAEDVVLHGRPARVGRLRLDAQELLAVVPLVQRLGLVEALVAL